MSNLLLIFMFLCWIIPSVIYKQYFLTLAFIIFGLVFGFIEFLAKWAVGRTVSQQVWDLMVDHRWKGMIVVGFMLVGWLALLAHLSIRFKKV